MWRSHSALHRGERITNKYSLIPVLIFAIVAMLFILIGILVFGVLLNKYIKSLDLKDEEDIEKMKQVSMKSLRRESPTAPVRSDPPESISLDLPKLSRGFSYPVQPKLSLSSSEVMLESDSLPKDSDSRAWTVSEFGLPNEAEVRESGRSSTASSVCTCLSIASIPWLRRMSRSRRAMWWSSLSKTR